MLVDDIGSFPLPSAIKRETFEAAYRLARKHYLEGKPLREDAFVWQNFGTVTLEAFKMKLSAGLDVANYPQQYDGVRQISEVIQQAMEKGTFTVEEKHAFLPEVQLIKEEAKHLSEDFKRKIQLRVCLFGPLELYLRGIGTVYYADVLNEYAETIRRFAKNSLLNTEYVETAVVSLDEPSFGYINIDAPKDDVASALEKAFSFKGATKQIHLHTPSRLAELLAVEGIDVLSFEYAASPRNIESVSPTMLAEADKKIRVGIARTDIDALAAELQEKGVKNLAPEQYVEDETQIRKRFLAAKQKYGSLLAFTGPDCGLGSWPTQTAATLLLKRTVNAVRKAQDDVT
jgi:5-methyltetrahydropteroyltriglutamate--homocysteine methyltransferase